MSIRIGEKSIEHFGVFGVLHLLPLPGSPRAELSLDRIWTRVLAEAKIYRSAGIDGLILENHGDSPFSKDSVPPHVPSILAVFVDRLKNAFDLPIGINILRNDAISALGAAFASGGDFIRVNVLTGVTATDQGLIEGCADRLLRYRDSLRSKIAVFADAEVKFGTPLFRPDLATLVKSLAQRASADAVIVTGVATGSAPDIAKLKEARQALRGTNCPVLCGSGADVDNIAAIIDVCDGAIVGSAFKKDGYVENPVEKSRVVRFMRSVNRRRVDR